ncbi:MAG: hypothetical protein U9N49_08440, partial [Campylobacterota bacterium]|nr:hypothetical protein [Campylobacterota bacterium]
CIEISTVLVVYCSIKLDRFGFKGQPQGIAPTLKVLSHPKNKSLNEEKSQYGNKNKYNSYPK